MLYANVANNVVVGIGDYAGEMPGDEFVSIDNLDRDYIGRVYNPITGTFGERLPVEPVQPEPSEMEILTAKVDYVSMIVEGLVMA